MVDAGWCYEPLPEADDCVACFYCGVRLDGWEPKDDPRSAWQPSSRDFRAHYLQSRTPTAGTGMSLLYFLKARGQDRKTVRHQEESDIASLESDTAVVATACTRYS